MDALPYIGWTLFAVITTYTLVRLILEIGRLTSEVNRVAKQIDDLTVVAILAAQGRIDEIRVKHIPDDRSV